MMIKGESWKWPPIHLTPILFSKWQINMGLNDVSEVFMIVNIKEFNAYLYIYIYSHQELGLL
jgi:hypothetical protein